MKEDNLTFEHKEYPSYQEREEIKHRARIGYSKGNDRQKVHCLLNGIIWSHYWRAREHLEANKPFQSRVLKTVFQYYVKGMQLDIDKYTENWLFSMKDKVSDAVLKQLKSQYDYEPKENKYLPKGHTCYIEGKKPKKEEIITQTK